MKDSTGDVLGGQIISNEIAIISMLQVLTRAQSAVGKALLLTMRENNRRVPRDFPRVRERIAQYMDLLERQFPA